MPMVAQELWEPQLKFTAGSLNVGQEDYVGQSKAYGFVLGGVYPLHKSGGAVIEGGYKLMPNSTTGSGLTSVKDDSDIYFLSASYRHELWRNGIYVQGGLRGTNAKTMRRIIYKGAGENGADAIEKYGADRETKFGWCLSAGYRLTDLWSFEVGASTVGFKNVDGVAKNATIFEVALIIHR